MRTLWLLGACCMSTLAHAQSGAGGGISPAGGGLQPNVGTALGFTGSSDVAPAGGWLIETENTGRFGKIAGRYAGVRSDNKLGYGLTDSISLGLKVNAAHRSLEKVPMLQGGTRTTFEGLAGLVKWRALERGRAPFGLSLEVGPDWGRTNGGDGSAQESWSLDARASADVAVVGDWLYAGSNLAVSNEWAFPRGPNRRTSFLEASAAIAVARPTWSLGVEARRLVGYGDLLFRRYSGAALYVGPTASVPLGKSSYLAGAWAIQATGDDPVSTRGLNLTAFERHQVRLKLGYTF